MQKTISYLNEAAFLDKRKQAMNFLNDAESSLIISNHGEYCSEKGVAICNFFIRLIDIFILYGSDCNPKDHIFIMEVITKNLCLRTAISFSELGNSKWLATAGVGLYLTESKYYRYLLQIFNSIFHSVKDKEPAFKETGMHFVNGQWIFAAPNLLIYPNKLQWSENTCLSYCKNCNAICSECHLRLNSSLQGTELPDTGKKTNIILSLITLLQENIQTALPIFMMNLLSCVLSVFSKNSLFVPIILWVTGEPGVGKTQLAMYLGTFYNKSKTWNDRQATMNRLRANASTKLILKRLKNSRDNVFLLDDIKAENSTSLKEHTNTNADTTIRSAYDQNLEGDPVCCNAIITGEYVPSGDSTLARLILLPLKNFREASQNLKTLKDFQENEFLVADFVILFIQWICQKLNEDRLSMH